MTNYQERLEYLDNEVTIPNLDKLENRERPATSPADLEVIHERALLAAHTAVEMKGEDVCILDMHELVSYTDYLVLCTGRNVRLTHHIFEEIGFQLKQKYGLLPKGVEGASSGEWILMDFMDLIVHVFTPEARDFYRLDVLWKQAPVESIRGESGLSPRTPLSQ